LLETKPIRLNRVSFKKASLISSLPVVAQAPAGWPVLCIEPLGLPWSTVNPFLFCVCHDDAYPAASAQNGPAVVHPAMFSLPDRDGPNPPVLLHIWLNLPAASKMAAPHFTMFWASTL